MTQDHTDLLRRALEFLPAPEPQGPQIMDAVLRPPPTPAERMRQQARELEAQAARLERGLALRREIEEEINPTTSQPKPQQFSIRGSR